MIQILLLVALIALASSALVCAWLSLPKRTRRNTILRARLHIALFMTRLVELVCLPTRRWRKLDSSPQFANIAEGIHQAGKITKLADGAITSRYLLVKAGTDANHIALAGAADIPYGVAQDEAGAAEDPVNVQCLACAGMTMKVQTDGSGALVFGDLLVPAANGQVKKLAVGAGNYYIVGSVLQAPATVAGDLFEMLPIGAWKTQ